MNSARALFVFTIRQSLRDLKFWLVFAALLMPCGLVGVIRYFGPGQELAGAWELYHGLVQFMVVLGFIPLVCMIFGSGLICSGSAQLPITSIFDDGT